MRLFSHTYTLPAAPATLAAHTTPALALTHLLPCLHAHAYTYLHTPRYPRAHTSGLHALTHTHTHLHMCIYTLTSLCARRKPPAPAHASPIHMPHTPLMLAYHMRIHAYALTRGREATRARYIPACASHPPTSSSYYT